MRDQIEKRLERVKKLIVQRDEIEAEIAELLGLDEPKSDEIKRKASKRGPKSTPKPSKTRSKASKSMRSEKPAEVGVCDECGKKRYAHYDSCSRSGDRRVKGLVKHECCGSKQVRHKKKCKNAVTEEVAEENAESEESVTENETGTEEACVSKKEAMEQDSAEEEEEEKEEELDTDEEAKTWECTFCGDSVTQAEKPLVCNECNESNLIQK